MKRMGMALRWLTVLGAALLLSGCSIVTNTEPLPARLDPATQEKLEGVWWYKDGYVWEEKDVTVSLRFISSGTARFAQVSLDDQGKLEMIMGTAVFTEGKNGNYLSVWNEMEEAEEDAGPEYLLMRYALLDNGDAVMWMEDPEPFEAAVESGFLHGYAVHGEYKTVNVSLDASPETVLEFLESLEQPLDLSGPELEEAISEEEIILMRRVVPERPASTGPEGAGG